MTAPFPSPAEQAPLLDQLDEALAKGTADGFWRFVDHGDRFGADNRFEILDDEGSVAVCSNDNDATETTGFDRVALILAAVNALPQLTAALRAAWEVSGPYARDLIIAALTAGADTADTHNHQNGER